MSKGKYHDRQDLGTILQSGSTIKIRQTNPDFKGTLKLHLLTNDRNTEKVSVITSAWTTITADAATTPFVSTPFEGTPATIEYKIEGDQKPLPIYEHGNDESKFFETWDKNDSEFALIKHKDFQLYAPKLDREAMRNLDDFASMDDLIDYYEDIFRVYNQMIGLKNGDTGTDKMTQNRYFLKADKSGIGGAYYGSDWTANSEPSVSIWLDKGRWSSLHEIGHGYQSNFDGKGMYTGEVTNNLFATHYQYKLFGKEEADKIGWLFNGKKEEVEKALYQGMIKEGKGYTTINDNRYRLILLTMLKQKAGDEAFARMHQGYRKLAQQPSYFAGKYMLPDLMNKYYSETSGYDFTPTLEKWQLDLDPLQTELNRARSYEAVAPLADIVPESKLAAARQLMDPKILITSNFELVNNKEVAPLGLKGNAKITLDMEDLGQLEGKSLLIKEGKKIVATVPITKKELQVSGLPNGVYTIALPNDTNKKYEINRPYLYIKEQENALTIAVNEIKSSKLANQSMQFLGLADIYFGEFKTNLDQSTGSIEITTSKPHVNYSGEKYTAIAVHDEENQLVYEKEIQGTNALVGLDTFPLKEGYKVKIFHAEPKNRLKSNEDILDYMQNENNFIMTKWGLQNIDLVNNAEANLIQKIEQQGNQILADPQLLYNPHSAIKSQLWVAIASLSEPNRMKYLNQYAPIFDAQ
ncbi:enhancin [Listeria grandensis]|uniref:Enhancin n=2 Tax=Listeria grandensis TaxID=1494963 RepID=A0A7X1CPE3_9LIST|nr:enhancin [Listeria grandensis]